MNIIEINKRIKQRPPFQMVERVLEIVPGESVKTLKKDDNLDREKAFVETMSSEARYQQEMMQQKREQRYEKMIEEAGPVESPMSRK